MRLRWHERIVHGMERWGLPLLTVVLAVGYSVDRTLVVGRVATLEAEKTSLHARVDFLERAFLQEGAQDSQYVGVEQDRRLSEATESRATIRVDAPSGVSEVVLGGEDAPDNVILSKAHERDGANFTLSRNETRVLDVGRDGTLSVHTSLHAPSVSSQEQLELKGSGGVVLQHQQVTPVAEVDGTTEWSLAEVLLYTGDTVLWSWTNYHNVAQIDERGSLLSGGIRSGDPMLASSFAHTFSRPGVYRFKSQAADDMRMTVEVREFAVRNGTLVVGGDLEVGGELSLGGVRLTAAALEVDGRPMAGSGFENEVRFFLSSSCPPGWTEATETMGKLLASRGASEEVGTAAGKAGISVMATVDYYYYSYLSSMTRGCSSSVSDHRCDRNAAVSVTMSAPDSFALLACKHA